MNKYIRTAYCVPYGAFKMAWAKLFHFKSITGSIIGSISSFSEITMDSGAKLCIGKIRMRDGTKIRVREGRNCVIGNNVSVNSNNMIACHESVKIDDNVQFSPNVQIYDHGLGGIGGITAMKYKTVPVKIGNNVLIGANTVIVQKLLQKYA